MSREVHVRIWEGAGVRVPRATRLIVLCNGTKRAAQAMKEELRCVLTQMGLTLSEEKTHVTHITAGFDFLGYRVIRSLGQSGKMVPKVLIPQEAIKRFTHKVRRILAPSTTRESTRAKIVALNQFTRGWCQYYRSTSSPAKTFRRLKNAMFLGMAHWLGRKYKVSMPKVLGRFYEGGTFRTLTTTLIWPTAYKARFHRMKTWHNPYVIPGARERETPFSIEHSWNGTKHPRQGRMDRREEVILSRKPVCSRCGQERHSSEVEMDHIIPRARFRDALEADRMDNLHILCIPCHRAKTKTDLKVLSRMRSKPPVRF